MRLIVKAIVLTLCMVLSNTALARGVFLSPNDLSPSARASLLTEIKKARAVDPTAFKLVAALGAEMGQLDANKRGRLATITPALKALGQRGLMPMLEQLAVQTAGRGSLNDTAWLAWRLNLLEAVGSQRDSRSEAVLSAILLGSETDFLLMRAAAQALGKIGSNNAASLLIKLSKSGSKRLAVLAGMGHCRRKIVATRLAQAIAAATDAKEAKLIAHSIGDVGSAWAWQTPVVAASGEEATTRAVAAASLVNSFVAIASADVRKILTQAVLVVDAPTTPTLIAKARKAANQGLRTALDQLLSRYNNSPLH